jgi:hypothetical protein
LLFFHLLLASFLQDCLPSWRHVHELTIFRDGSSMTTLFVSVFFVIGS